MGIAVVLVVRLIVPLAILRWPFWGTIAALLADGIDIIIFQLTAFPGSEYQRFDKLLDTYYILLQFVVVQRWEPTTRWVLSALFAYRMFGAAAYEITGKREVLAFFPNLFTFYFAFVAGLRETRPTYELTRQRHALWLAAITLPVLLIEYALHGARRFDRWRAVDIIRHMFDATRQSRLR